MYKQIKKGKFRYIFITYLEIFGAYLNHNLKYIS